MHRAQNDYIDHSLFLKVRCKKPMAASRLFFFQFEKHCADHIFEHSDARNQWQHADRAKGNNFPGISRKAAALVTLNLLEEDKAKD